MFLLNLNCSLNIQTSSIVKGARFSMNKGRVCRGACPDTIVQEWSRRAIPATDSRTSRTNSDFQHEGSIFGVSPEKNDEKGKMLTLVCRQRGSEVRTAAAVLTFSLSDLQISKPQMERRRRERINHSLETLRLLLLENTDNEVKTQSDLLFMQSSAVALQSKEPGSNVQFSSSV